MQTITNIKSHIGKNFRNMLRDCHNIHDRRHDCLNIENVQFRVKETAGGSFIFSNPLAQFKPVWETGITATRTAGQEASESMVYPPRERRTTFSPQSSSYAVWAI